MKLIVEQFDVIESLVENTTEGKKWYLEGRYMQGGREGVKEDCNANGRIYTESVLDSAAGRYIREKISNKTALGELSHPIHPQINPDRVCLVVEHLTKDGMHYNGKSRITEGTPMGQIVIGILEAGGRLGVSTRALGSLREFKGIKHVNPDLMVIAVDCVTDPSGRNCWMTPVLENTSWEMLEDGTIMQVVSDVIKSKINEEKAMKAFAELMIKFGQK